MYVHVCWATVGWVGLQGPIALKGDLGFNSRETILRKWKIL